MLFKTHLIITLFFSLLLFPFVENLLVFFIVAMISTCLPDIDSKFSVIGRKKTFRIIQLFTKHRGIFHSFSFLIVLGLILYFYFPLIWVGFCLGYGLHLLADCFTKRGLRVFYPLSFKIKGFIKSGGYFETFIFVVFLLGSLFLIFYRFLL